MAEPLTLTGRGLTVAALAEVARRGRPVGLDPRALERMVAARAVVERHLRDGRPVYGLTTGLGERVSHALSPDVLAEFSRLTVLGRSNALGPGLPREVVRALMTVRLNGLLTGASGAAPGVAEALAGLLNAGVHPVVPAIGSVGAGDLCLLAHVGLALIGEGEADFGDVRLPAAEAMHRAGLAPIELGPKDGLAICNASAATAGQAALTLADVEGLAEVAGIAAALSMEGFRANPSPLDPRVAAARPQPGQPEAAARLRALLAGGGLLEPGAARRLQDPISLRCAAAVLGSLASAVDFLRPAVDAELDGAADNPLVLVEDDEIVSTGNFHTPGLTLALDTLRLALAQVSALSVTRAAKLLTGRLSGLPANLSPRGPSRSGFAPLMKTAEALHAEIRHLAQPVPNEPRWASDGVEDDTPNGFLAARQTAEAAWRLRKLLAIELLVAAQAVDLREGVRLGHGTAAAQAEVRKIVPALDDDRPLGRDVERLDAELLETGRLPEAVRAALSSAKP